jgi:hypothetical protein
MIMRRIERKDYYYKKKIRDIGERRRGTWR